VIARIAHEGQDEHLPSINVNGASCAGCYGEKLQLAIDMDGDALTEALYHVYDFLPMYWCSSSSPGGTFLLLRFSRPLVLAKLPAE